MLESFPVILLISTLLGFLAGIGVGGGSLLLLWLTLVAGIDHSSAKFINLCFFLPSAAISSLFRIKEGRLPLKKVLPAILCGCLCAWAISSITQNLDEGFIRKGFGILLLCTGIREVLYKPKDQRLRNAR